MSRFLWILIMFIRNKYAAVGTALLLVHAGPAAAQKFSAAAKPKTEVRLAASVDAVVAGAPFDLALHFGLSEGWHIYWKNSGDSGMPPSVAWHVPDGLEIGELQFPVPRRSVAPGNIVTNVLGGEPILLATATPPKSIEGDSVTIRAELRFLQCNKTCIRDTAAVELTLPVAATSQPANEALFRAARRAMPKSTSKYLTVSGRSEPPRPRPGEKLELLLDVRIKPGYHIQSNAPLHPAFIATEVFLERAEGLDFDQPSFPAPSFRTVEHVGKVSEFAKDVTIRIPGALDETAAAPPERLAGLLRYQACNEAGSCFPPEAVAFDVAFGKGARADAGGATTEPGSGPAGRATATVPAPEAADTAEPGAARTNAGALETWLGSLGLPGLLVMCFLYGMAINATPCVLPLLSIKVLTFVQHAHESRVRTLLLGLTFGLGVMLFFIPFGLLASQGRNILQFPLAVILLGTVVLVMALSMLGVFTLQVPAGATKLDAAIQKEGLLASFGKGLLAPVLGFACTAPLMAGGLAWATSQPPGRATLAFIIMGLGMAFPYMLLGANPRWLSFLPRPGNWMITFERIMGFLLLGLVVLLIHPLVVHLGVTGFEWTLVFLVAVGMACWLLGQVQGTMPAAQRWRYRGGAGVIVVAAWVLIYGWIFPLAEAQPALDGAHGRSPIAWRTWSREAVEDAVHAGNTVFIDFTAAYCTNCKVNKAVAIYTPEVVSKIEAFGVIAYQGDFTTGDEQIREELQRYGAAAVPLNLLYRAGDVDHPMVLKTELSKEYLLAKLDEAGPSRTAKVAAAEP